MVFLDSSNSIGVLLNYITINITGSQVLTYMLIVVLIMAVALLFRIPLMLTIPLVLPLLVTFVIFSGEMYSVLGAAIMYLAFIMAGKFTNG